MKMSESDINLSQSSDFRIEGGLRTKGIFKKSQPHLDLITVVTVVYNNVNVIESTIKNLLSQSYSNVEYIVVDGGSTDGTLDIIRNYEEEIDYFVSEKDRGIYDAMNKALAKASGDWVYFLNCGDVFFDNSVLASVQEYLSDDSLIVHFNCSVQNDEGCEINVRRYPSLPEDLSKWPCVQHQSVFCRRSVLEELGGFDTRWQLLADYDFFVRAFLRRKKFSVYPELIVSVYNSEGVSAAPANISLLRHELKSIQLKNFGQFNSSMQFQLLFKQLMAVLPFGRFFIAILRKLLLTRR